MTSKDYYIFSSTLLCYSTMSHVYSLKAAIRPILAWKIWRLTCAPTLERNRTFVNTKAATRLFPTPQTGPSTRIELIPMRYSVCAKSICLLCCANFVFCWPELLNSHLDRSFVTCKNVLHLRIQSYLLSFFLWKYPQIIVYALHTETLRV